MIQSVFCTNNVCNFAENRKFTIQKEFGQNYAGMRNLHIALSINTLVKSSIPYQNRANL